jgi:hypothetical protein
MTTFEKLSHRLLLGAAFTIMNWFIVTTFIIEVSFFKYFFIELLLVLSMKFFKFTLTKFKLNNEQYSSR